MTRPDLDAVARHGIGRGDYAAIVLSGSVDTFGEVAGSATWSTARRFALKDPRLPSDRCLARRDGSPYAPWTAEVEPLPGVCFVFADAAHPGVVARTVTEIVAPDPRYIPIAIMDTIAVFQRR